MGRGGGGPVNTVSGNGGGVVFNGGRFGKMRGRTAFGRGVIFGGGVPFGWPSASRNRRTRSSSDCDSPPRGIGSTGGGAIGVCASCACFAFETSHRTRATNKTSSRTTG